MAKTLEQLILCFVAILPLIGMVGLLYLDQDEKDYIKEKCRKIVILRGKTKTEKIVTIILLMIIASYIIFCL